MKLNIDHDLWEHLGLPYAYIDKIHIGSRRWFETFDLIFEYDGKLWSVPFAFGSTEMQEDENPFDYEDVIQATQVEKREVTTSAWIPV